VFRRDFFEDMYNDTHKYRSSISDKLKIIKSDQSDQRLFEHIQKTIGDVNYRFEDILYRFAEPFAFDESFLSMIFADILMSEFEISSNGKMKTLYNTNIMFVNDANSDTVPETQFQTISNVSISSNLFPKSPKTKIDELDQKQYPRKNVDLQLLFDMVQIDSQIQLHYIAVVELIREKIHPNDRNNYDIVILSRARIIRDNRIIQNMGSVTINIRKELLEKDKQYVSTQKQEINKSFKTITDQIGIQIPDQINIQASGGYIFKYKNNKQMYLSITH